MKKARSPRRLAALALGAGLGLAVGLAPPGAGPAAAADDELAKVEGTERHPLEPPDTSSPRATFQSFLTEANAAWRAYLSVREAAEAEEEPEEEGGRAAAHVRRAARCIDFSQVPPAQRDEIATQTVVLLLDVFNRIPLPAPSSVPDAEAMAAEGRSYWTIPHTSIQVERIAEGPRQGEWLFSPGVVENAREYYRRTRHLPLKPGAVVEDGFEIYVALAGWMIPVRWIEALPEWTHGLYLEQTVWQWALLLLLLAFVAGATWLVLHWSRAAPAEERASPRRRLVAPLALMALSAFAQYMTNVQLGITGAVFQVVQTTLSSVFFLAAAWAAVLLGAVASDAILSSPRLEPGSIDEQLVRMGARVVSLVVAVLIVVEGARTQGIPVVGVVAGLGVGGLAVALAAQSTIENFIGSLTLFADRPVRVGDFCRFGDQMGTVEQIGLRSTRIRTLDRSVLTVPNAEFSRLQIDNLTRRDAILFKTSLHLSLETTAEQLQAVLDGVRRLLLGDERVDDEPARVRLVSVGPHSLELEIFAYVKTNDWNQFLGIREELYLAVLAEVERAGTALSPPAQATYLRGEVPAEALGAPGAGGREPAAPDPGRAVSGIDNP